MSYDTCRIDIDSLCLMGLDYCRQYGCQNKNNGCGEPYKLQPEHDWCKDVWEPQPGAMEAEQVDRPRHVGMDKKPLPPLVIGSYKPKKKNKNGQQNF